MIYENIQVNNSLILTNSRTSKTYVKLYYMGDYRKYLKFTTKFKIYHKRRPVFFPRKGFSTHQVEFIHQLVVGKVWIVKCEF